MKITEVSPNDAALLNHVLVALTAAPLPLGTTYADASRASEAFQLINSLCVQAKIYCPAIRAVAPAGLAENCGLESTETTIAQIKKARGRPKKRA